MLTIKDAMVLIHLSQTGLLETACLWFGRVAIPPLVLSEIQAGNPETQDQVLCINECIQQGRILVKPPIAHFVARAHQFNLEKGEAESVALYWQEHADWLASDDGNVRKKSAILQINVVGTPAIMLRLFRDKKISKAQFFRAVNHLKTRGWFSPTVFDVMQAEAGI